MTSAPAFPANARLADGLIERATMDQLADVARLLALDCGYYQQRYGDVHQDTPGQETLGLLSVGMQNLVSALAEVTGLTDDLEDEPRH